MSFINNCIKYFMKERRGRKLAAEYEEASSEIKRTNQEFGGVISDGLD